MNILLDDTRLPFQAFCFLEMEYLDKLSGIPNSQWTVLKSYDEFEKHLSTFGMPEAVSFDHDLDIEHIAASISLDGSRIDKIDYDSFKEKTGYHAAILLKEYAKKHNLPLPKWYVHSVNKLGANNIREILNHE